jgi:hypothetical protein
VRGTPWRGIIAIATALLIGMAGAAFAQETGNVFGTVSSTDGSALPGVTVTLTGFGATQFQVTDSNGGFRFLGLDPGAWQVKAELGGFSTVEYPNVVVSINRNTEILLTLSAAVEEVISVTAESPLLDERKVTAGTTISQIELEKIPSARDPWVVMTQAAGVLLDKVNVGGSRSGQQSNFIGAGTGQAQNGFYLDGAEITNRQSSASSPTYYDFDQFAEYQLHTGGSDVTRDVPGVTINLVTKRGSNEFRGSARFLLTDQKGYFGALEQGNISVDPNDLGPNQDPDTFTANQVDRVQDYGFEAGGPLWSDRLWAWASWGNNDISRITQIGTTDRTILENTAIKLNAQFTAANSAVASFNNGDKRAFGRGSASNRGADSLWNQRGPTGITKVEDTHVFGSNFFLSGQYVFVDGGFQFASTGGCGPDGQELFVGDDGIFHGRNCGGTSNPSTEVKLDATYFATSGALNHEIKFGGRFRETEANSGWTYPGRNILNYSGSYAGIQNSANLEPFGLPSSRVTDLAFLYAYRGAAVPSTLDYAGVWVQDTMTWGKWTVNAGVRYDTANGENEAGVVPANPAFPDVMPAIPFDGNDGGGIKWSAIQPRVGVTYALGEERKTLLRASIGRFADPMTLSMITRMSPLVDQYASINFVDDPGGRRGIYDTGEAFDVVGGLFGFDPQNPTAVSVSNRNDPNMDPPLTDEFILGVEHAFLPEFVVGLQYTHRVGSDIADLRELFLDPTGNTVTVGAPQYVNAAPISFSFPGESEVFTYQPQRVSAAFSNTGGTLFTNGNRETTWDSLTLNFTKRLSNQWMMRGYVQYGEGDWDIPTSYFANNDPNILIPDNQGTIASNASVDGALKVEQAGGQNNADIWMQASWAYNVNGMYQFAPNRAYGFNIVANIYGREGYPIPYFVNVNPGDGINRSISANEVALGEIDAFRTDDLLIIDFRIEKEFAASGNTSLTLSIDGFNLLNEASVLSRASRNLNASTAGNLNETMAPRIWRLGARLNWR